MPKAEPVAGNVSPRAAQQVEVVAGNVHRLKRLVLSFSALTLSVIFSVRLVHASSLAEMLLEGYGSILFACYGLYTLFENEIKRTELFKKRETWIHQNKIVLNYIFLLGGLIVVTTILLSYSSEDSSLRPFKLFGIVLLLIGAGIICARIIVHLKART
jgi:hypothetical protein